MEVYPRSSWFLLLLGFALIAATLQETTDCPQPDQVSCTSGTKCSSNADCQAKEICCANACYTKRCTPRSKGVQGDAESEGPSETDCRPYIEKALKELETGEAAHTQKELLDQDESTEDVPTVEITDDSSHQVEEDGGQGEASEEIEAGEEQSAESLEEGETQQEAAIESSETETRKDLSGETPDEKEVEESEEKAESEEDTKAEPSKEESAEEIEQSEKASAEDEKIEEEFQKEKNAESQEEISAEEVEIVKREIPIETIQPIPVQAAAASQEDEQSTEDDQHKSEEESHEAGDQSVEGQHESEEKSIEAAKSEEQESEEKAESIEAEDEKVDEKSDEDDTKSIEKPESVEADKSEEQKIASAESTEEGGCPDPRQVSCTEGDLCSKHRQCGESRICCPNNCYRKRCIPGTVSDAELEAESASEESQEEKSAEKSPSTVPETGCPPPNQVSCTEGEICGKHRHCDDDQICCPNSCYRKRCTPGTATSAELEAESEEESKEETKEESAEKRSATKRPETGCPSPEEVSCTDGELCSKHKQCGDNTICCPNKCYRKRCTPGKATDEELAAESEEEVEEEVKRAEVKSIPKTETGCPPPSDVSCTEGELCSKHRQCSEDQICCPNHCYRKRCTPGTATPQELEAESEEDLKEEVAQAIPVKKTPETGCPPPSDISCTEGELCSKHRQCDEDQICCPNHCYRKRCTPGKATPEELEAESEEDLKEEVAQAIPVKKTPGIGCPERGDVSCTGEICSKNKHCKTGEICCANKCYRRVCVPGTPDSEEEDESEEETVQEKTVAAKAESVEIQEGDCPPPSKVSCSQGERCGDDDDCSGGQICCVNTCYTKRCVPGPEGGDEESEEEKPALKVPPQPRVKIEVREDISEEVKVKTPPPPPQPKAQPKKEEPKPEVRKPEVKKPEPKVPSKPLKVVEVAVEEEDESLEKNGEAPVEDLSLDTDIPTELRPRDHVEHLLKLDKDSSKLEHVQNKVYEETLKELKKLYENAIKPLEVLYKYRDLSNRHFGDAEIFSKPLILFMGPWSGGKSSIINYLINNEYNETSLRTGAEPSPAYFNILTYGDEPDIIDGTELAADFTFSGLQKFGQGLEERLRGIKLPSKLLEKVNIVEIPGILEVRKQVSRVFPFNDACQWFIDRADIIFLVYDPSKLDVGPETEAILDQLKGREHQTRIILNKADQVKPEELMRVQGALIWNISPLMSSAQPPVMYTTSLWSRPYEPWAPVRLLQAQERAFLRDLRTAVDKRVENKIASARRFAVRVRNHAKMVDCYLTTYYNHKSVFGNRKQVANEIIEHPQDYHIYEGLSTLTNISRYDLPDPDVYRDFFKLNPLYEFQQLSATCTYFRGCPINRLDIAIAYDLPELVGTYKRNLEEALANANNPPKETSSSQKTKKSAPGS